MLPDGGRLRGLRAARRSDHRGDGRGDARPAARAGRGRLERAGRHLRRGRGEQLPARLPPAPRALRPAPRAPLAASLRRHRHRPRQLPRRRGGLRAVRLPDAALRRLARGGPGPRGRLRSHLRQGHAACRARASRRWWRCAAIVPPTTSATTASSSAASSARAGRTATSRPGTRSASRSIPPCAAPATSPRSTVGASTAPGPEVEERYHCTSAGIFEVTLAVLDDGFSRTFRIARPGGRRNGALADGLVPASSCAAACRASATATSSCGRRRRSGVAGFARNLPDGTVEVVAEGGRRARAARGAPARGAVVREGRRRGARRRRRRAADQGFHIR